MDEHQAKAAAATLAKLQKKPISSRNASIDLYVRSRTKSLGRNGWFEVHLTDDARAKLTTNCGVSIGDVIARPLVPYLTDSTSVGDISFLPLNELLSFSGLRENVRVTTSVPFTKDILTSHLLLRASFVTYNDGGVGPTLIGRSDTRYVGKTGQTFVIGPKNVVDIYDGQLLEIGDRYAFFIFGDFCYIFDERMFENITGFNQVIEQRANEAIDAAMKVKGVVITNEAVLRASAINKEFARKLAAAHSEGIFKKTSKESLLKEIKENQVAIDYEEKNGELRLTPNLDTRENRREFIDLLMENCWISKSGQPWRAVSKQKRIVQGKPVRPVSAKRR